MNSPSVNRMFACLVVQIRDINLQVTLPLWFHKYFYTLMFYGRTHRLKTLGGLLHCQFVCNGLVNRNRSGPNQTERCAAIRRATRVSAGKRDFGSQIEIRCWDSIDAREAKPVELPYDKLFGLSSRMVNEVPGVVSVTYNVTSKPPSTMEAV